MDGSCNLQLTTILLQLANWFGGIIRSLFPWPALIIFLVLFAPVRSAFDRIVTAIADSLRTLRHVKAVGVEMALDPQGARELAATSTAVVAGDFARSVDKQVARMHVWERFESVIKEGIAPLAQSGFRATIHIQDILQPDTLFQLVEYMYVSEPLGNPATRHRRNSIRFGIIGRSWRLGQSEYDPNVTTDVEQLVKFWGMTRTEAERAGRSRRSFAVILLRGSSGGYSGLIFIDSESPDLFGHSKIEELARVTNAIAERRGGLSDGLSRIRNDLAQEFRHPIQR